MRAASLLPALLVLGAAAARAQSLTRANGHPLECAACHGDHAVIPGDSARLLRISKTAPAASYALNVVSRNCLRCHYTAATRAAEMTAEELAATGGAAAGHYVWNGSTLANHALGGADGPQCAACHRVHEPGLLVPAGVQQRAICTGCHADQVTHPDAAHLSASCSSCHAIHASDSPVAWPGTGDPLAALRSSGAPPRASVPASPRGPLVRRVGGAIVRPERAAAGPAAPQRPSETELRCLGCHRGNPRPGGARLPNDVRHAGRPACLQCHAEAGRGWGGGGR